MTSLVKAYLLIAAFILLLPQTIFTTLDQDQPESPLVEVLVRCRDHEILVTSIEFGYNDSSISNTIFDISSEPLACKQRELGRRTFTIPKPPTMLRIIYLADKGSATVYTVDPIQLGVSYTLVDRSGPRTSPTENSEVGDARIEVFRGFVGEIPELRSRRDIILVTGLGIGAAVAAVIVVLMRSYLGRRASLQP